MDSKLPRKRVLLTITKVTHTGRVTTKQMELIEDTRDYKTTMRRYSGYKRWGNTLVSYLPEGRVSTTVIITNL